MKKLRQTKKRHKTRRRIYGSAFELDRNVAFTLRRGKSHEAYGLRAVDFICWSIFRKFEYNDTRFFNVFSQNILRRREWYI